MEYIYSSMMSIVAIVNEMSPFLLLGFLIAGILHVFMPKAMYNRYLSGKGFRSVFYATMLGIPLPLCSCGVIPTAMSLRKEGASKGATVSFLISTPETGVDSIAATYSLMGLPFAIVRPVVALFTSLFAGTLVNNFAKEDSEVKDVEHEHEHEHEHDCCCHDHHEHHHDDECCCHHHEEEESKGICGKVKSALDYAFVEMMGDIGKWLVVGLLIAGVITVFVPESFWVFFKGNTLLSMLLVLCIAIPMYICATGSIPIAVALIMKGLTPGAALVLLMAGPACNMASMLLINKMLGKRTLMMYLASIVCVTVLAGFAIDQMPAGWFMPTIMNTADMAHEEGMPMFNVACSVLLGLLLLNSMRKGHDHCHCHEG